MVSLWPKFCAECKSRLSAIARSCYLGRRHWNRKYKQLKKKRDAWRETAGQSEARCQQLEQEAQELRKRIGELESERSWPQPVWLPVGKIPPGQQYGVGLIVLAINLARKIGLRPTVCALQIFFAWLDVGVAVPSYQTVRGWMQRLGLYRMRNAKKRAGDVWLTDHSNQIGKEKVLVVMRVLQSQPGVPLRHEDLEIVALVLGEEWKRENVAKVYQKTADCYGTPRAIESDGAVELREPVETLGKPEERPISLRDPKHFFANQFEKLLQHDPQYDAFVKQLGGTRSTLHQTELAHFIPPSFKVKARFMNLAPTLRWAATILWHLDHPESQSRQGITNRRMNEKLGWLRDFAANIRQWQECQAVIHAGLKLLNEQGIFRGVAVRFQRCVAHRARGSMSQQLVQNTVEFLREHECKLRPGERLPMSTEILESSFALFKQLERQHSKSGFTSLLLTFPTLLRETKPQEVIAAFANVRVADVQKWQKDSLPITLAAKRQRVFREARTKNKKRATTETIAA